MSANEKIPEEKSVSTPNRLIAFRPLFWWVPISLLLLAYDFHRINAPRTIITASVTVDGRRLESREQVFVSIDGERVSLGKPVPVGKRRLKIEAKDATAYEEDVDVWYGANNIGSIDLKRQRGVLDMKITPGADLVELKGPYQEILVKDVSALRTNIPVGSYDVALSYGQMKKKGKVTVKPNETVTVDYAPAVGIVELDSKPAGARFLLASTNRSIGTVRGDFPKTLALHPGNYSMQSSLGDYRKTELLKVARGLTNQVTVAFEYGVLDIKTEPEGVSVQNKRKEIGVTPVRLEMQPGNYDLQLRLSGHEPIDFPVEIVANQNALIATNLVSLKYNQALLQAQRFANRGDYKSASVQIGVALSIDPDSSTALKLKSEYEQQLALIDQQSAILKQRERVNAEFERRIQGIDHANLFDTQSLVFSSSLQAVRDAVRRAVPKCQARFQIESEMNLDDRTVLIKAKSKGMSGYGRHCVVLVAENSSSETQVVAKLWDYIAGTKSGVSIGALLSLQRGIPVHPKHFPSNERQWIQSRRQAVIDEFRNLLETELKGNRGF